VTPYLSDALQQCNTQQILRLRIGPPKDGLEPRVILPEERMPKWYLCSSGFLESPCLQGFLGA